jgi:hypothetical protein
VNDLQTSSQSFAFKLNVSAKNDIPVILSASDISFDEDTSFKLKLSHYQVTDPDNFYPADFTLLLSPGLHYTVKGDTIIPDENYNGTLQVPVRVKDILDQSAEFIHHLTINPVNDPPSIIIPDNRSIDEGEYFEIQLVASDVDQTDLLQISSVELPTWLSLTPSGKLQGTPLRQSVGENTVRIRVSDAYLSVDSIFTIKVKINTGISLVEDNATYLVMPNPASAFILIKAQRKVATPAVFRLFSTSGIQMIARTLEADETILNLNDFSIPQGIFFYEIIEKSGKSIKGKLLISPDSGY